MTATNERFYYSESFPDTESDIVVIAALFAHVATWESSNPQYALQTTTIQYDIVRAPFRGGPYGEIIWYAELR